MKQSFKMEKNLFFVVILFVTQLFLFASFSEAQTIKVGVILDLNSSVGRIGFTSLQIALSDFYKNHPNYSTRIQLHVRNSSTGVTGAAASALDLLKNVHVDAIIGPQKSAQAAFIIDLANAAYVPVASFSATSPSLPAQSPYFIQTGVNDAAQVDAIAAVVKNFRWSQVVLVYEDSDYGSGIIPYLSNAFQEVNARVSSRCVIPVSASDDLILRELYKMKTLQTRVFVVHMSSSLASRFFLAVKEAEMMSHGYAWIVTTGLMDLFHSLDSRVVESMQGVVGVKPLVPDSKDLQSFTVKSKQKLLQDYPRISPADQMNIFGLWAYDTLWALGLAAERVGFRQQSWSDSNSTNMFITQVSPTGPKLLQEVERTAFEGLSGEFCLTNRQLEAPPFQIVNVVGNELREVGIWNTTSPSSTLIFLRGVAWPGGESAALPKGWELPVSGRKLRVAVPAIAGFPEFVKVEKDPQTNATKISGYFIDVFDAVIAALPYAVRYEYVSFDTTDASVLGTYYDELTRQVSIGNFDVAVGDITITANRSHYVDFSFPVEEGGVTRTQIVKYDDPYDLSVFMSPLDRNLWLSVIALVVFTGVALWILERRFNKSFSTGTASEQAGLILFIPFASLLLANSERIATNLGRVVMVTFLFAVLILNSTYTANLSAILTMGKILRDEVNITTLVKNGDYVGYRGGSFIGSYLTTRLGFDEKKTRPYREADEFVAALNKGSRNGGITAFFSCTPYTNMFLTKYCDSKYRKVGQTFLSEGYGFAFPKGSPMVADVSRAIVELMDDRRIEDIKERWFRHSACSEDDNTNTDEEAGKKIRLKNFIVLFGISAAVTAACLAFSLASYLSNSKHRDSIRKIFKSSGSTTSKIIEMCKHFDKRDASMARRTPDSQDKSDIDGNQ